MRSQLVSWLVDVHERLDLNQDTLYQSVSIVDRFTQKSVNIDCEEY